MKRLTRDTRNAMIGGVAAGLADHFDVDPAILRICFVVLTLISGVGLLAYIICWIVIPEREPSRPAAEPPGTPADRVVDGVRQAGERVVHEVRGAAGRVREDVGERRSRGGGRVIFGAILILVGLAFLIERLDWFDWWDWVEWAIGLWPVLLILMGLALLVTALRGGTK
jgi:phage shock protein PspC (stress-responsive transcriptional regulator)